MVEYFLSPISATENISSFLVGNYVPWLSDHCIITTEMLLSKPYIGNIVLEEQTDAHPSFLWNELQEKLEGCVVKGRVHYIIEAPL